MTPPESTSIALELAELRRAVDVGNATTQGQLALLVQRGNQYEQDIAEVKARVDALERARWPLPSLAAVTALCALGLAVWQAMSQ
ncbi:hypothetical protein E4N62_46915 [Streptomyces sp. MNU76]|uniref:hypothetical protein n=1 Tax=Streptomyces sp. MNU76 TaxID=2560026 RepID=UPI001E64F3E2|nr:hypothetical protein [Streptomyces sp. MNU76]MCC9712090.1 hypothetical protein [Streptomyces sp. MNU76]